MFAKVTETEKISKWPQWVVPLQWVNDFTTPLYSSICCNESIHWEEADKHIHHLPHQKVLLSKVPGSWSKVLAIGVSLSKVSGPCSQKYRGLVRQDWVEVPAVSRRGVFHDNPQAGWGASMELFRKDFFLYLVFICSNIIKITCVLFQVSFLFSVMGTV